jgi:CheY-like chemotaxis protein
VEIADVIAAAIEIASPLIEIGRHRLTTEVPRHGLVVHVDRTRMAQVMGNLLTNAAKYTPTEGRISVTAVRARHSVVCEVKDSGSGIAPELLPKVFDLFVQSQQTLDRARGGLGLGLTIVKNLVTMHGGTVAAESAGVGQGSAFTVCLPAVDARPAAQPASGTSRSSARKRRRVLVVDDNEDAAAMLAETLNAFGYTTAVAHDGPAALRTAEQFHPDTALLDIGLPVMDGYELAERLQEQLRGRDLLLVAITGYGRDSDKQRSRDAGFHHHFTKPLDLDALTKLLREETPCSAGQPEERSR